jgi:PhnB protein
MTPYLIVRDATKAIDFYANAFGATEVVALRMPDGKVAHAELEINGQDMMMADEFPEMGYTSPDSLGGSSVSLYLRVADVDTVVKNAVALGATCKSDPADQFDGDRRATIVDPFGHTWLIATQKENVSKSDLKIRFEAMMQSNTQ